MTSLAEAPVSAVDARRLTGQLMALSLVVWALPAALALLSRTSRIALWWDLTFAPLVVLSGVVALTGRPRIGAGLLWTASVAGALTLPLAATDGLRAPVWLAVISPVATGACVLLSRRVLVCGAALAVLLIAGSVPRQALQVDAQRPSVLSLLLLVAIWAVSLALLRTLEFAQRRVEEVRDSAVDEFVAARAAEATIRAEQAWDAYLHNEVIAALAVISDGSTVAARAEAERVLAEQLEVGGDGIVPTPWVGSETLDAVLRHRPDAETVMDIVPDVESVPAEVRRAVFEALSEALRNVDRHAYGPGGKGPARVEVVLDETRIWVRISDEGRGFEPGAVDESRMGMAISIQARMDAVGGWSRVRSRPGQGACVELGWEWPVARSR